MRHSRSVRLALHLVAVAAFAAPGQAQPAKRPFTWLDMQTMRSVGTGTLSPDGKWLAYQLVSPDWNAGSSQSDLYLVSTVRGVPSTKQLTSTPEKNEMRPRWTPDGSHLVFVSNREAKSGGPAAYQLYVMRPDSGEPRRVSDAPGGVGNFDFTPDGARLVFRSGRPGAEQLYALATADLVAGREAKLEQLTKHPTSVDDYAFAPDGRRVYFVSGGAGDPAERARAEKRFTMQVRDSRAPVSAIWSYDLGAPAATRLTPDSSQTVMTMTLSGDGRWIAFRTLPDDPQKRRRSPESQLYSDLFLLETATGRIERLTRNAASPEVGVSFSPDSRFIVYSTMADTTRFNLGLMKPRIRRVDDAGGAWRALGEGHDGDITVDFWSPDGRTIYFNDGVRATTQLFALDVASGRVRQLTDVKGVLAAQHNEKAPGFLLLYQDPTTPMTPYYVPSMDRVGDPRRWVRLVDANPQLASVAFGETSEVAWTSKDGTKVGGVLVKPVGWQPGKRYPLLVILHGGPHAAETMTFNGDDNDGPQVYAGAGYMVFAPNYRGSTGYGEKFKLDIVGDYMTKSFEDVMSGVDHLIAAGLVDSARMGVAGHSAGGTLGHWIVTHTDRFKAVSAGQGVANWISMFAVSDVQVLRRYWMGGSLPYDDFATWWRQSPIAHVRNARTPILLYTTEDDARVPGSQAIEMYEALVKVGAPAELHVYEGTQHGVPGPRNRMAHGMAEQAFMDYHVRGTGRRFAWKDVLATFEEERKPASAPAATRPATPAPPAFTP